MGSKTRWVFAFAAGLFFFSTLVLRVENPAMYNSPDERAAALLVETFTNEGKLYIEEPLNPLVNGVVTPRSLTARDDRLYPVSFIGLPFWFGLVGNVTGVALTYLLTPLLAIIGVYAWKRVVEKWFGSRTGVLAGLLLLSASGFWFYSARVYMHNVAFVALAALALFFWVCRPLPRGHLNALLSGACVGTALLFRTSEILWMLPLVAVLLFLDRKNFHKQDLVSFLLAAAISLAPFFIWNTIVFGSPLSTAYNSSPVSLLSSTSSTPSTSSTSFLFPFGLNILSAGKRFLEYGINLTWWTSLLAILGLPLLALHRLGRRFLIISSVVGLYLILFYGSWKIADNPDPHAITLANSYVRYWLPITLTSTVPAALFIEWLSSRTRTVFAKNILQAIVLLAVALFSFRLVFFHPEDGLLETRRNLLDGQSIRARLVASTEEESVIIVDRADKFLFPVRRVVVPLRAAKTYDALPALLANAPTYYYGITLPPSDLEHLNTILLPPEGARMQYLFSIGEESLYQFFPL